MFQKHKNCVQQSSIFQITFRPATLGKIVIISQFWIYVAHAQFDYIVLNGLLYVAWSSSTSISDWDFRVFSSSRHWVALRCMLLCVIVDSKEGAVWSEQPPYLYFRHLKEKIYQISRTDRGCWSNIRVFKMSFKLFKKMGRRLKSQNFLKSFCFLKIFPKFPFKYTLQDVSIYLHLRLNHICFEIEKNSIWIHFLWKMTIPKQGVSLRAFCIKHKRKVFIKPPCFSGKLHKNWN